MSTEQFLEWLPVVGFPARGEMIGGTDREACVVEDEFCAGAFGNELEFNEGVDTWIPAEFTPGLNDALVGNEFDVATDDVVAEDAEGATWFAGDFGGFGFEVGGFHCEAEQFYFLKLFGV